MKAVLIPTTSALGLDQPPGTDLTAIPNLASPRFTQIYYHNRDTSHLQTTSEVNQWMCQEHHRLLGLPFVSRLDPAAKTAGQVGFVLRVHGGNFSPTTRAYWRGGQRQTTFVDSTTLATNVTAADIADAAEIPVVALNPCGPSDATGCPLFLAVAKNALTIAPAAPTTRDEITATYTNDWLNSCVPTNPQVKRTGNLIAVRTSSVSSFCTVAATPYMLPIPLGRLPAGDYEIVLTDTAVGGAIFPTTTEITRRIVTVSHPLPVITQLTPSSIPAASANFTLTVNGTDFAEGASRVFWNGAERPDRGGRR